MFRTSHMMVTKTDQKRDCKCTVTHPRAKKPNKTKQRRIKAQHSRKALEDFVTQMCHLQEWSHMTVTDSIKKFRDELKMLSDKNLQKEAIQQSKPLSARNLACILWMVKNSQTAGLITKIKNKKTKRI